MTRVCYWHCLTFYFMACCMHQVINCKGSDLGLAISKDCFSTSFLLAMCRPEKHYSLHLRYKIHKDTTSKKLLSNKCHEHRIYNIFYFYQASAHVLSLTPMTMLITVQCVLCVHSTQKTPCHKLASMFKTYGQLSIRQEA